MLSPRSSPQRVVPVLLLDLYTIGIGYIGSKVHSHTTNAGTGKHPSPNTHKDNGQLRRNIEKPDGIQKWLRRQAIQKRNQTWCILSKLIGVETRST